jgi:RimJ/RimL family protein N-acetyltransferase
MEMEVLEFVKLTPDDINEIQDDATVIWRECYSDVLEPEQIEYMIDKMYSAETITNEIQNGIAEYYFIFHDGAKIGYTSFGLLKDVPGRVKLHKLYLYPEFHGKGLGSAALRKICKIARGQGYTSICLNVNKYNAPALRAYERNGFVRHEAVVNDIGNGYVMDDYVMVRTLG